MSTALYAPLDARLESALSLLPSLGFSAEVIARLDIASKELSANPDALAALARLRETWPEQPAPEPAWSIPLASALAVIDAFPALVKRHAALQVPFSVTARTLRDLERRIREYIAAQGIWGFDRFAWMQSHLTGSLFELGRLQFVPGRWREAFDIYREGDAVWSVANPGLACDLEGFPTGKEERDGFPTQTRADGSIISGHLADPLTGAISRLPFTLPGDARLAVTKDDPVLHVHIPSGPGFSARACSDSLREARRFFDRHFPQKSFKAICCRTWLLDPALNAVLPPDSNIPSFGRLFRPLSVEGADDKQHIERIFGSGDWKNSTPATRLQKSARNFLEQGGRFRLSAGYLLWDELL